MTLLHFILYTLWFTLIYKITKKITENILDERWENKRKMGKLTDKEVERILANANATVLFEGMIPSKEANEITRRYLKGELTSSEAVKLILDIQRGVK